MLLHKQRQYRIFMRSTRWAQSALDFSFSLSLSFSFFSCSIQCNKEKLTNIGTYSFYINLFFFDLSLLLSQSASQRKRRRKRCSFLFYAECKTLLCFNTCKTLAPISFLFVLFSILCRRRRKKVRQSISFSPYCIFRFTLPHAFSCI